MFTGIIYCAHCLVTGKKYIGQTIQKFEKRISRHKLDSKKDITKFYSAANKYGWDNFIWGIIEECDRNTLTERELYWIEYYNTFYEGYNSTHGGDGGFVTHCREFEIMSPNGDIIKGENVMKFCRENNLRSSEITSVLNGKRKSHKGWKLPTTKAIGIQARIESKSKSFTLISPEGKIVIGKNRAEFCRKYSLSPGTLSCLINKKYGITQYRGWRLAN